MKAITVDDRTPEEKELTQGFIIAKDNFLSGWGSAPNRSLCAVPYKSQMDKEQKHYRFLNRSEFSQVRIVEDKNYKPVLQRGDHYHVYSMNSFLYKV